VCYKNDFIGTSVCWHLKTRLESGRVTADLTTTVVHSSKLLTNDVKPDHSLTLKEEYATLTKYVKDLKGRLRKAYDIAFNYITTSQRRQEDHYSDRVRGDVPEIGDRVLVKIVAFDDKWKEEP